MRLHHADGNRLLACEYFTKALESDPEDIECLNACGILLDDASALAKRDKFSAGIQKLLGESAQDTKLSANEQSESSIPINRPFQEASHIFNLSLRYTSSSRLLRQILADLNFPFPRLQGGKCREPSIYSCMRSSMAKLTPTAMRGFKSLESYRASLLWGDRQKGKHKVLGSWGVRTLAI